MPGLGEGVGSIHHLEEGLVLGDVGKGYSPEFSSLWSLLIEAILIYLLRTKHPIGNHVIGCNGQFISCRSRQSLTAAERVTFYGTLERLSLFNDFQRKVLIRIIHFQELEKTTDVGSGAKRVREGLPSMIHPSLPFRLSQIHSLIH